MADDTAVTPAPAPEAPSMARMMVDSLKSTVEPILENAKPTPRVMAAWKELCDAFEEWIAAPKEKQ